MKVPVRKVPDSPNSLDFNFNFKSPHIDIFKSFSLDYFLKGQDHEKRMAFYHMRFFFFWPEHWSAMFQIFAILRQRVKNPAI